MSSGCWFIRCIIQLFKNCKGQITRAKPIYLSNLCKQYHYASFEQLEDLVLKPWSYFLFFLRFLGWCEVSRMHSQRNDSWKVRFRWKLNSWYFTTRFSSPSTKTNFPTVSWSRKLPQFYSNFVSYTARRPLRCELPQLWIARASYASRALQSRVSQEFSAASFVARAIHKWAYW